jgi:hypothetical protein
LFFFGGFAELLLDRTEASINLFQKSLERGRMFVRMCPYLPFSARVCLNQHHWLASRMREEGVNFEQCSNAFRNCAAPKQSPGTRRLSG